MAAIQRDPTRNDLRMKLLETLYTTAATNLHAFKQVARDLASQPESLKSGEWEQVIAMGRQIAADDALFAEHGRGTKKSPDNSVPSPRRNGPHSGPPRNKGEMRPARASNPREFSDPQALSADAPNALYIKGL